MTLMPGFEALRYDLHEPEPADAPHRPVLPVIIPPPQGDACSELRSGLKPGPRPDTSPSAAPTRTRLAVTVSLMLHLALAAAFIGLSRPTGMVDIPSEAISVEILPSAVFEAMNPSDAEEAAASPSSAGEVQASAEARPEPVEVASELKEKPERAENERIEHERPADVESVEVEERPLDARLPQPQDAEQPSPKAAELPPAPDEDAVTLPSGSESEEAAEASTEPASLPQPRRVETRRQTKPEARPVRRPPPRKPAQEPEATTAGSAGARGAEGIRASDGRISASRGSALNYAAIVRARIAANRPGATSARGAVTVEFGVTASGALTYVRAGGTGELVRSVEAAVRRAAPFPPPPPGAPRRFRMTFTFR